ncbi:TIGR00645 family protein [Neomegalonema perideroedes]|uniref:TIGR00645 family protein n=1 Tax=Neomegalonema perideroedes TaxID=217219 RepID=UPI00036ADE63|nr:TIGR00645 family protein [Neomegalonema perideroedes]
MERQIERILFASRWLMAPMYLGLVVALAILVWMFIMELVRFAMIIPAMTVNDAILGALALIDLSLGANLLLIVIFSGYENFVSRLDINGHEDRPEWQGEVDFSGLKLKLVASIVAISGIHLLKVFMDVNKYTPEHIRWMVVIHLVFVASGVLLAAMDWIANHAKTLKKPKKSDED